MPFIYIMGNIRVELVLAGLMARSHGDSWGRGTRDSQPSQPSQPGTNLPSPELDSRWHSSACHIQRPGSSEIFLNPKRVFIAKREFRDMGAGGGLKRRRSRTLAPRPVRIVRNPQTPVRPRLHYCLPLCVILLLLPIFSRFHHYRL